MWNVHGEVEQKHQHRFIEKAEIIDTLYTLRDTQKENYPSTGEVFRTHFPTEALPLICGTRPSPLQALQDTIQGKCTGLDMKLWNWFYQVGYSLLRLLSCKGIRRHTHIQQDTQQVPFHPWILCNPRFCKSPCAYAPYKLSNRSRCLGDERIQICVIQGTNWMIKHPRINSPVRINQKRCQKYWRFVNTFFP